VPRGGAALLNQRMSITLRARTALAVFMAASAVGAFAAPRTTHYGAYMNGRKIGRMSLSVENTCVGGKTRVRMTATSLLAIEMMGTEVRQESTVVSVCDEKLRPVSQQYTISSNGSVMRLDATYAARTVEVRLDTGASSSRKVLRVPSDGTLSADSSFLTLGGDVTVGSRMVVYYLNPLTVALDRAVVTVEAKERVALNDEEYDAVRMTATTPLGRIRTWESPPGEVLWVEMPLGMAMYRMDEQAAGNAGTPEPTRRGAGAGSPGALRPPRDFAIATSVAADRAIQAPRRVRRLTAEIGGVPDGGFVLQDARQRVAAAPGRHGVYTFRIQAGATRASDCPLPVKRTELKRYLAAAAYLDMDRPEIRRIARSLRDPRSAQRTASRIRSWLRRNLSPDYSIGVPRSATDVLKTRRGVCRDYAVLFGALARSAGLPTRLVGGLVYAEGRFFYHAWVECWTGAWTPFDATMDTDFVDATHMKFAQGDPTDMMMVFAVVGKLSVKVLDSGA